MAKWQAISTLTVLPATTIRPGEPVELNDEVAIILLDKGCIKPATIDRRNIPANCGQLIEMKENEHDTNDQ